jgi:hypothetical protein
MLLQETQVNPLMVPAQEPERYWFALQFKLEQLLHLNPFVVPLHVPLRYVLLPHTVLVQALHLYPPESQEPDRYWFATRHFALAQPTQAATSAICRTSILSMLMQFLYGE